jgi:hypothetical protein
MIAERLKKRKEQQLVGPLMCMSCAYISPSTVNSENDNMRINMLRAIGCASDSGDDFFSDNDVDRRRHNMIPAATRQHVNEGIHEPKCIHALSAAMAMTMDQPLRMAPTRVLNPDEEGDGDLRSM